MVKTLPLVRVGQTDLHITRLGFGSASIGWPYPAISDEQAYATVQFALDQGIRLIDTAPFYGNLEVETRLGRALSGIPRDSYILASKVGRPDGNHVMDFSADGVKRSIEGSLKRLRTDRIDILHLHDPDQNTYRTVLAEAYPILAGLRAQGVIKAVGVGVNWWELLPDFARDADFDCFLLAGRYTLLEQGALPALNLFAEKKISVFGAGIYNSGILATGVRPGAWYQYQEASDEIKDKVRRIQAVGEQFNVPLHAAAVQFVAAHPAMTALIIGGQSSQQLQQNLDGLSVAIPQEYWLTLRTKGLIDAAAPVPATVR